MNAPKRWLETEDGPAEALELLRAGRPPRRMDDAVRRRSRRRVAGLAMLPAAAGVLASWPQLALGALVGSVSTVAVMSALSAITAHPPATPSGSSRSPSPSAPGPARDGTRPDARVDTPTESSNDAAAAPSGSARRVAASPPPAVSASPEPAPRGEGLQQEIQLLEEARRKVASNPAQAERVLLEHEARFVDGQLRIERELLLIDALVRLGRRSEAEARARVLRGRAPTSLYGERLEQILGRPDSGNERE